MMEQMGFFTSLESEDEVYNALLPALRDGLVRSNAGRDNIAIDKGLTYSSVSYLKYDPYDPSKPEIRQLAFRICLRKGQHYFGVSNSNLNNIPAKLFPPISEAKPTVGFTNFDFEPTQSGVANCTDFLVSILDSVTYSILKEFDCCSRFEKCSEAGHCIHPNPALATSCGYRKALKEGKRFAP